MAVVNDKLTTIGGLREVVFAINDAIDTLFSLSAKTEWKQLLPPMPSKRGCSAAITTPTHLVVAGGFNDTPVSTVEVLPGHPPVVLC